MQAIFLLYIACGLITALLALPMMRRKVKPNPWYGFRVRATLENEEVWYAVNEHAGVRMMVASLAFLAVTLLLYLVPGIPLEVYTIACMLVFLLVFSIGMSQTTRYLKEISNQPRF